jgi:HK97 family phage major capsid protein
MAGFAEQISRSNVPIPETISTEIIQEAAKTSVMLERARRARMSTKVTKQPVLSVLPDAYWLSGDTALKQTTHAEWGQLSMTAEELAVLVPIPNAVVDDTSIPLWSEVRPLLVEAIGKKVDQATLFGVDKPASFPTAAIPGAIAAGNVVEVGTGADIAVDVATMAGLVAKDGFSVNGFAASPGLQWELVGLRSQQGVPIYTPSLSAGTPAGLYGFPLNEVLNGAWDPSVLTLLGADWTKFVIGVRQDMTFDMFDQMVISDAAGKVIFNAAQQDSKVMRVVFRVGFQVANPLTRINPNSATRYPAGVLVPAAG